MIKRDQKAPKLKAKGAETRHLLPFGLQLARELYDRHKTRHCKTVLQAVSHMMDFYMNMASDDFDPDAATESCNAFCLLYKALSTEADRAGKRAWWMKPKLHMFQELAEFATHELGNPAEFWNYKDEDFMGLVAGIAFRRGGAVNVTSTSTQVLNRYRVLLNDPGLWEA